MTTAASIPPAAPPSSPGGPGPGPAALERIPRPLSRLILLAILLVSGLVLLTGLGIWQVHRLSWKLDLIARTDQRLRAAPVAAPGPALWSTITAKSDEYRRVTATGSFLNDRETLVQAVTTLGGGFWVVTPLRTTAGFTVLVNRGFVPEDHRAPATRAAGVPGGQVTVTGLLRITEPHGAFLHSNQPRQDRWYSRDVTAIAAAHHLGTVAPYFIDADASPNPGGYPVGGLTVVAFRNAHLQYALTWFTLAALLAGAMVYVGRDEYRLRRQR